MKDAIAQFAMDCGLLILNFSRLPQIPKIVFFLRLLNHLQLFDRHPVAPFAREERRRLARGRSRVLECARESQRTHHC
jgi:hypothetical protein